MKVKCCSNSVFRDVLTYVFAAILTLPRHTVTSWDSNIESNFKYMNGDGTVSSIFISVPYSLFDQEKSAETVKYVSDTMWALNKVSASPENLDYLYEQLKVVVVRGKEQQQVSGFPDAFLTPNLNVPSLFRAGGIGVERGEREERASQLVDLTRYSILNAYRNLSKLSLHPHGRNILYEVEGMTSVAGRHLLNNLCSALNTRYLEVGSWKGSSLVSAQAGNEGNMDSAVAIDWWAWNEPDAVEELVNPTPYSAHNMMATFGESGQTAYDTVRHTLAKYTTLLTPHSSLIRADCFKVNVDELLRNNSNHKFNVYFYDAEHEEIDQYMAFTHYDKVLSDVFVTVIDDWNYPPVALGTKRAFLELGYTVLFGQVLGGGQDNNKGSKNGIWHNGMYVAVVSKGKGRKTRTNADSGTGTSTSTSTGFEL